MGHFYESIPGAVLADELGGCMNAVNLGIDVGYTDRDREMPKHRRVIGRVPDEKYALLQGSQQVRKLTLEQGFCHG